MAQIKRVKKGYLVRISYRDHAGNYLSKRKTFNRKRDAEEFANSFEVSKFSGELEKKPSIEFSKYFYSWYETYRKPNLAYITTRRYELVHTEIENYFAHARIADITRKDYQKFINQYGKNHAKDSVKKLHNLIKACVGNAVFEKDVETDFTYNVIITYDKNRSLKIDYLSLAEIKQLTAYVQNHLNPRYTSQYMIMTAIFTGARLGEIMALTWKDINFTFNTISINKSWNYVEGGGFKPTKTESSNRTIRVNKQFLDSLKTLKVNNREMVFENVAHDIPTSNGVNKVLRSDLKALGITRKGFHFHSLRHSHVAFLLSQNIDLYIISKRLGHSDIGTTSRIYAYLIDEYKARSDEKISGSLDKLFNSPQTENEAKSSIHF